MQAEAVGREGPHRRGAREAVLRRVAVREASLEDVASPRVHRLVPPDVDRPVETAASGELPLGLRRQPLAGPRGVRHRVLPRHVHHRMVRTPLDGAARPLGMSPRGSRRPPPPCPHLPPVHRPGRRHEHERSRGEQGGVGLRRSRRQLLAERLPVHRPLGHRAVAGGIHERGELSVGHLRRVDPEPRDPHLVHRRLVGTGQRIVPTHAEDAAWNPHHARRGRQR